MTVGRAWLDLWQRIKSGAVRQRQQYLASEAAAARTGGEAVESRLIGLGSPVWDTGGGMAWAGKPSVGHWRRHGMGWEAQCGTLAVACHGLGSPEWDTGGSMAWAGKPGVGHWRQHGMGWEAQCGTLAKTWHGVGLRQWKAKLDSL
eukprot:g22875.t1